MRYWGSPVFVKPIDGAPNGIPSWLTVWNQKLTAALCSSLGRPRGIGHERPDGYTQLAGLFRREPVRGLALFTLGKATGVERTACRMVWQPDRATFKGVREYGSDVQPVDRPICAWQTKRTGRPFTSHDRFVDPGGGHSACEGQNPTEMRGVKLFLI